MEYIINEKQFSFVFDYKDNKHIRDSFNALTQKIYSFNFEQWYQDGYWLDSYIPYSLVFDHVVVANVSISLMDFNMSGERKKYIQVGTVMTDPDFRNRGLSGFLMGKVMEIWSEKCDMMYLFANHNALDFYPKFGFEKVNEYQLSKKVECVLPVMSAEKFNMADSAKRQLFVDKVNKSKEFSSLAMKNNIGLIMFYCTSFMKENIYYISKYDAYAVAEFDNDILYLQELFCETDVSLDEILAAISINTVKRSILGFDPTTKDGFEENLLLEGDTTLFVLGKDAERFRNNHMRFPVLSHA